MAAGKLLDLEDAARQREPTLEIGGERVDVEPLVVADGRGVGGQCERVQARRSSSGRVFRTWSALIHARRAIATPSAMWSSSER